MKTEQKLADEFKETHRTADNKHVDVEPTAGEIKNGWDKTTLNAYLVEQHTSQSLRTDINSMQRKLANRPTVQNHKYNPLRWRG